jgi:hypothetical protein
MDKLLFWLGIGAAQKGAGSKPSANRHPVLSFAVGTLLALLIAAGLFIPLVSQQRAHVGRQQRKCAAHHFVLGTSQEGRAMASTNKSLAQMNKSQDVGEATNKA